MGDCKSTRDALSMCRNRDEWRRRHDFRDGDDELMKRVVTYVQSCCVKVNVVDLVEF